MRVFTRACASDGKGLNPCFFRCSRGGNFSSCRWGFFFFFLRKKKKKNIGVRCSGWHESDILTALETRSEKTVEVYFIVFLHSGLAKLSKNPLCIFYNRNRQRRRISETKLTSKNRCFPAAKNSAGTSRKKKSRDPPAQRMIPRALFKYSSTKIDAWKGEQGHAAGGP